MQINVAGDGAYCTELEYILWEAQEMKGTEFSISPLIAAQKISFAIVNLHKLLRLIIHTFCRS